MSWFEVVKGDDNMTSIDFKYEMFWLSFHHSVWSVIRSEVELILNHAG